MNNELTLGTIWITGITASGKTTLGKKLYEYLLENGIKNVEFLDGDELRNRLTVKYGHSIEDRFLVVKEIVNVAKKSIMDGNISIVSTISHKREMREYAREQIPNFMEVFLRCDPDICADRDYKGQYKIAKSGEYDLFVGVTEPYEESLEPDFLINTGALSEEESSSILIEAAMSFLNKKTKHFQ